MDTQAQKQAIIDKLAGAPANTLPPLSALDEPWRTIYRRVARAPYLIDAMMLLAKATGDLERGSELDEELCDLLPGEQAFTPHPSLHEMSARLPPVDWLWPSWIPRGVVTLLGGAPGTGKSLVALDLARRIIHGEPFPDGAAVPCPGSRVLIVDAEGAPALLDQRARAWEIDRRRLFLMLPPKPPALLDLADPPQKLRLLEMIRDLRPALVVVDSLAAATARGETSLQGARDILGILSIIASRAHIALLIVHHLRKRTRTGLYASSPRVAAVECVNDSETTCAGI